jgi:Zn finger protein HypA/HybF involved in hydrogenase expression
MTMMQRKLWHKDVTEEAILEACERASTSLDNPGICLQCGGENDGCEPDAERYRCEHCGAHQVYGAEALLLAVA